MAALHTDDFRREAARIALTSCLTCRQVASDIGFGPFYVIQMDTAFSS
jgi:transposase